MLVVLGSSWEPNLSSNLKQMILHDKMDTLPAMCHQQKRCGCKRLDSLRLQRCSSQLYSKLPWRVSCRSGWVFWWPPSSAPWNKTTRKSTRSETTVVRLWRKQYVTSRTFNWNVLNDYNLISLVVSFCMNLEVHICRNMCEYRRNTRRGQPVYRGVFFVQETKINTISSNINII